MLVQQSQRFRTARPVILWLTILLTCPWFGAQAAEGPLWQADYQRALELGRQTGRPVLVHFSATWCAPCQKMDRDVFAAPEIQQQIANKFIAVRIDFDKDPAVARRFSVESLPTDLILDPANGQLVARSNGPMGLSGYGGFLQRQEERYRQTFAAKQPMPAQAAAPAARPAPQPVWYASYSEALAAAERLERPMLIHFYAPWCGPCARMDREVFAAPDVQRMLSERFVAVKINTDQEPALSKRFGVNSLPSDLVVEPFAGRMLAESEGFLDRNGYLSMLARMDSRFAQLSKAHMASRAKIDAPTQQAIDGANQAVEPLQPQVRMGDPKPLVGLDGHSPVALSKGRRWIKGDVAFAWQYQGIAYYMASREEHEAFRANPEQYAPQLLGCDCVLLTESDRAIAGSAKFAAFYDEKLYLFTNAENRQKFRDEPARYLRMKHALKPDRIEGLHLRLGDVPDEVILR